MTEFDQCLMLFMYADHRKKMPMRENKVTYLDEPALPARQRGFGWAVDDLHHSRVELRPASTVCLSYSGMCAFQQQLLLQVQTLSKCD